MTDLHTHILPGMDDGAATIEEAISLLCAEVQQGVDTVALTPHFYRSQESAAEFLARREIAWNQFQEGIKEIQCPKLVLGAEVAWTPRMVEWPELDALCYENTKTILIELPITPWHGDMFRQLYSLEGRRGIIPMIAHAERYFLCQSRKNMDRLLEMGYPLQVSAVALLFRFGRRQALQLLEQYDGVLISDCHNMDIRRPNMGDALKFIEKKRGQHVASEIAWITDQILENE